MDAKPTVGKVGKVSHVRPIDVLYCTVLYCTVRPSKWFWFERNELSSSLADTIDKYNLGGRYMRYIS